MKRTFLLIALPFIVFTFVSLVFFQKACDYVLQAQPKKDLPYSHMTHTKYLTELMGSADCQTCHGFYENGRFKGLPSVGDCTQCHDRKGPMSATGEGLTALRKPMFDKLDDSARPWEAFAKQPDLVYFSHKVVMTSQFDDGRKKMICTNCHGDKSKTNDTGMLKGKMLMGQCMDCHTALQISNACAVCHD